MRDRQVTVHFNIANAWRRERDREREIEIYLPFRWKTMHLLDLSGGRSSSWLPFTENKILMHLLSQWYHSTPSVMVMVMQLGQFSCPGNARHSSWGGWLLAGVCLNYHWSSWWWMYLFSRVHTSTRQSTLSLSFEFPAWFMSESRHLLPSPRNWQTNRKLIRVNCALTGTIRCE